MSIIIEIYLQPSKYIYHTGVKNYICTLLLLITPYFISQILLGNTNEGSPSLNYLIRSGELSEIENTPIYTNEGINFSIGGVHHEVFVLQLDYITP